MVIQGNGALALRGFRGVLGQDTPPAIPQATSYQEAFDASYNTCVDMLGEDECRRLLGYAPFLCPPPAQRPMYAQPLFWLFSGLLIAKVFF